MFDDMGYREGVTPVWESTEIMVEFSLSHEQTLSANQRSLNVRYISCNHALVS